MKGDIQESQYAFPYHYIPSIQDGDFKQHVNLSWGYEYISYMNFLAKKISSMAPGSLLDVGCGDGRFLSLAASKLSNTEIIGIDYSQRAIALASALNEGIPFKVHDMRGDKIGSFDCITLVEVLEHIEIDAIDDFMGDIEKNLSDLGRLVITVPSANTPVQKKHYQHFTIESLEKSIEKHFKIEEIHYLNARGAYVKLMNFMMTNRFFCLNFQPLLNALYGTYVKRHLISNKDSSKRICVVCSKK